MKAIVFGATGQVGSYLVEHLLREGYQVVAAVRRVSVPTTGRLSHVLDNPKLTLAPCDVTDAWSVRKLLLDVRPGFVFNLAAQSFVRASFDEPLHTTNATYLGALNVLEGARALYHEKARCKVYQASSSEMYGSAWSRSKEGGARVDVTQRPPTREEMRGDAGGLPFQDEETPFLPNSPYAVAKLASHHLCRLYRKSYGIFASSGIVFNTESERRGEEFVTRKVTRYVGRLKARHARGLATPKLQLGNLDARRDWSHAEDTARAMEAVLWHDSPDDFCIASGDTWQISSWVEAAFAAAGFQDWREFVAAGSPEHMRPCEVPYLRGRPSKARTVLGWESKVGFFDLVRRMVEHDVQLAEKEMGGAT